MIYLDLDETLILTDQMMWGKEGAVQFNLEDGVYHVLRRPIALDLIRMCRDIAPVRVLTMGTRDYALAAIKATGLPFKPEEVISRTDFLKEDFTGWVYTASLNLSSEGVCPDAVLVDNQHHREGFADLKMRYLGIGSDRYIKISSFTGYDNRANITEEVSNIVCQIKNLKS